MLDHDLQNALTQMTGETKALFSELQKKYDTLDAAHKALQIQTDAIDAKGQHRHVGDMNTAPGGLSELKRLIGENKENLASHGRIAFEVPSLLETKSVILSTGLTSVEPATGIQGAGRFPYRLRQLFRTQPTLLPTIGVLRSTTEALSPAMQVEGSPKGESTIGYVLVQALVQTLATFVTFSKQALDDIDGFGNFLDSTLIWSLERKAEQEILSGDGTGTHLPGLLTTATAYNTSILGSGYFNLIDVLGAAAVQLSEVGYSPDFAVVSPRNWFKMVSLRTSIGSYVFGDPRTAVGQRAYSLEILPSPAITGDTFLVGDSSRAIIRERESTSVSLSYEHSNNFTSNLVTALAETRFGIQTLRPDAFATGTLASSPAGV